jgi:DNA topoisomerase-2
MVRKDITYVPALIKIFSEILDNSIDEYKRHPDILTSIRVEISATEISIADNGAGIPVEIHPTTQKYVPETVFTNLRAGSNFDDDEERMTIGTNGVGSSIAVILSSSFKVETCDGKNKFTQEYLNGLLEKSEPKIKPYEHHGTKVTFVPDFEYFGIQELDADHIQKMMKRVVDIAGCNPNVKFYLNGERIQFRAFSDYVSTYQEEFIYEPTKEWKVAVACSANDTFEQISFVNSVETYNGGTHVDYVFLQIAAKLRELFKKKHKVDITPGMLKNHVRLFISCDIDKPKFNSQTKDCMVSETKSFGTSFEVTDKFARKIMDSPIVQSVLDWVLAKEDAARRAELRKLNKDTDKVNPRSIEKLNDASKKGDRSECMIFLSEGDSAATAIKSAGKAYKDPTLIGSYPLRGKPLNVCGIDTKRLVANQVFSDMMVAIGLKMGEKVETVEDGKWVTLDVNGEIMTVNENDFLFVDGAEYRVKDLVK